MSLSFARHSPMSVQVISWALMVRPPLQDEVPELQALLATLRKRWGWLAGIYLIFLAVLVLPGLLRERGADYTIAAVVLPHLLLMLMLSLSLNMWAGFRVSLGNVGKVYVQNRTRWSAMISFAVLFAMGFLAGLFGGDVQDRVRVATRAWLDDTLTPAAVGFLLVVLVLALPELVARMRQQQHALSLRLAEARTAQERLARVTAESELRLLQAQVEPHFLYNTLANLRFLVQTGSPDALRMTDALIDYLRTSVPDMRAQQVTLGREVDHARHYLDIMQMRMGGRLQYAIDVPPALRDVALPPLVLLTLVENAVKHGIAPLVEGGSIRISAAAQGDDVIVDVADDGAGLAAGAQALSAIDSDAAAPAAGGTGLRNVSARLALAYGERAQLRLSDNAPRGTRATLRLPASGMLPDCAAVPVMVLADEESQAPSPLAAKAAPGAPARPVTLSS